MGPSWKDNHVLYLLVVGAMAWLVPGGGHYLLKEKRRAAIILVAVALTFLVGLYVGSIGVIDKVNAKPWYWAQVMNTPAVFLLGDHVADAYYRGAARREARAGRDGTTQAVQAYSVFGRAGEIGQIYTSVSGLLNLLCIINAIYMAHLRVVKGEHA